MAAFRRATQRTSAVMLEIASGQAAPRGNPEVVAINATLRLHVERLGGGAGQLER